MKTLPNIHPHESHALPIETIRSIRMLLNSERSDWSPNLDDFQLSETDIKLYITSLEVALARLSGNPDIYTYRAVANDVAKLRLVLDLNTHSTSTL